MTPTNEIRWVERRKQVGDDPTVTLPIRVLQQRWATSYLSRADQYGHSQHSLGEPTEWRDVPVEKEE